jgi:hypothetical protein
MMAFQSIMSFSVFWILTLTRVSIIAQSTVSNNDTSSSDNRSLISSTANLQRTDQSFTTSPIRSMSTPIANQSQPSTTTIRTSISFSSDTSSRSKQWTDSIITGRSVVVEQTTSNESSNRSSSPSTTRTLNMEQTTTRRPDLRSDATGSTPVRLLSTDSVIRHTTASSITSETRATSSTFRNEPNASFTTPASTSNTRQTTTSRRLSSEQIQTDPKSLTSSYVTLLTSAIQTHAPASTTVISTTTTIRQSSNVLSKLTSTPPSVVSGTSSTLDRLQRDVFTSTGE